MTEIIQNIQITDIAGNVMNEVVEKKKIFNEKLRIRQKIYRDKDRETYNNKQKEIYEKMKLDPERNERFKERCKINARKYREKKKLLNEVEKQDVVV